MTLVADLLEYYATKGDDDGDAGDDGSQTQAGAVDAGAECDTHTPKSAGNAHLDNVEDHVQMNEQPASVTNTPSTAKPSLAQRFMSPRRM